MNGTHGIDGGHGIAAALLLALASAQASAPRPAFGVASVLTQTVAVRPRLGPGTVLALLAVAALATAGLLLAQAAYRGGLGALLATATLVNPAVAAAIGLTLLGEDWPAGPWGR